MYYLMTTGGSDERATIGVYPDLPLEFSWVGGRRFSAPPPQPLNFEVYREGGIEMPALFVPVIPLMHHRLLSALRTIGVDNLDDYDAAVVVPQTGVVSHDYRAVNVVGTVAAADLERSTFTAPSGRHTVDVDFDHLEIDESVASHLLVFRLAESVSSILVHERVRDALEPQQFPMLKFARLADIVT